MPRLHPFGFAKTPSDSRNLQHHQHVGCAALTPMHCSGTCLKSCCQDGCVNSSPLPPPQLGLSGLTYGCRAVAYQLLNLLAELETAETAETTADELLTSIVSGGRDTEMLRRLLVDFLDPDGYTRADIPEQGDYDQVTARVYIGCVYIYIYI